MTKECTGIVVGKWLISKMSEWNDDYIHMERPARLVIQSDGFGTFNFGLVDTTLHGEVGNFDIGNIFDFTFEGSDECDPCSGQGHVEVISEAELDGWFEFANGDESNFKAVKIT